MANTQDKFTSGPSFRWITPTHPYGTDPSKVPSVGQPPLVRKTATQGWIRRGDGRGVVGRMSDNIAANSAQIECVQANVLVGKHLIRVADFELRVGIDFAVGPDDATLATNLAAALEALPGITAGAVGDLVTISTTQGQGSDVRIEIVQATVASAFDLVDLERDDLLDKGEPRPIAPLIA